MLTALTVLGGLFALGFVAGYGVRELISRRRRREYRRSVGDI